MNTPIVSPPGLHQLIEGTFDTVHERIRTAFKAADFEIVAEIDLADMVASKSQSYGRPCRLLVVCHADTAHKALTITPDAAVLLPCPVAVSQLQDGQVEVRIADPIIIWSATSNPYLKPVAEEFKARLERVMAALQ